jgi:cyclase
VYDAFMSQFAGRFADMELVTPAPLEDAGAKLDLPRDAELLPFVPAHTPADVAVWVPGSRTLFTGDLCFFGVTPLAIQGLVSSWVAALDALLALEPDAVVPGHGPVGTAADITVARDYLAALVEHGRAAVDAGAELDDAVSEFRFGPGSDWPESERTLVNLERAMQEARGEISAVDLSALPPSFARLLS